MSLLLNQQSSILWRETIKEAEDKCDVSLDTHLENYLVALLSRYTDKPDVTKRLFAKAVLHAMEQMNAERNVLLQQVGDECLIFSGLFPEAAKRKNLNIAYFVDIGRSAYAQVSYVTDDIFDHLASQFVLLMDVLQSIRPNSIMMPLDAYEQWISVRSERAHKILNQYCAMQRNTNRS